jgi:K+-sensing histidine kinase KdpD
MERSTRRLAAARLYAGTVIVTLLALAVSLLVQRVSATPSYAVFAAAVAIAARYGGKGPAFVSSGLSLVLIDYFLIPPIGVIDFQQPEQGVNIVVFGAVAFIITSMTTKLRRAERDARDRAASLARVNAGTEALSKAATVAEVARVALDAIGTLMPVSRGAVYLLRRECLNVLATSGDDAGSLKAISMAGRSLDTTVDFVLRAALSGDAVWVDDGAAVARLHASPATVATVATVATTRYHVAVPLVSGDAKLGVLAIDSATAPPSDDAERSLIRLFAHSVASALVRAKQYDAERGGREAAETLARAREEALAIVAHDLRNPLALVGTATEMLAEVGDDPARRREMIEIVRRAVKRMNVLISDLLDITRLQAGHLALESEALSVNDLFKQVATSWTGILAKREIGLHVVFPRADLCVQADPGRIAQVLDNLIGNAGKFTPSGGRVVLRADGDVHGQVRFSVSDNGAGIAPEAQPRLFDRFWQARRADRRGIGMGLTICKGIVEAHGGRIWCESTPDVGTKFFFTIPSPPPVVHQISA